MLSFKKPATWLTIVSLLVVSIFLVGFASNKADLTISNFNVNNADLQPMVFVNSTIYRISAQNTSYKQMTDEFIYIGEIKSTVNTTPTEEFQANDNILGAKVYQYHENIVVLIKETYYLYENANSTDVPDENPVAINRTITNEVLSSYIAESGLSRVVLLENNRFYVEGRPEISYTPMGSYEIDGNKLYLNISENQQFIFSIYGNSLIFESGEWLENWIPKETVFILLEDEQ